MRQIKFRAWDIENKKMSKPFNFENVMSDGGYGDLYNAKIHDDIDAYEVHDDKKYSLMQFTGLTDKNGKEIYEGDLLKHNKNIFKVRFSSNQFVLLLRDIRKNNMNWRSLEWANNVQKYIEIIGNIHGNEELIPSE